MLGHNTTQLKGYKVTNWDSEVESSAGGFYGWGNKVGQKVTGTVVDYSPTGGNDFNGDKCPLLMVELTEESYSHSTQTGWSKLDNGQTVKLTCGLPSLNECVRLMRLEPGDLAQIELVELSPTNKGNPAKIFKGRVARGQGQRKQSAATSAGGPDFGGGSFGDGGPGGSLTDQWSSAPPPDDSEPPF